MTAFEHDGQLILGGRELWMPFTHIANPREDNFDVPFKYSIYRQIIAPFCDALQRAQRHYLDTFNVAYIPPGAGALYDTRGNVKKTPLGDAFLAARRNLLNANKRVLVDLRRVTDPEFRDELERVGVKASPVNAKLSGPGITGHELLEPDLKPRPAPPRPRVARASPFAGSVQMMKGAPTEPATPKGRRGLLRPQAGKQTRNDRPRPQARVVNATAEAKTRKKAAIVLGVAGGIVVVTAATIAALSGSDEKK